MRKIWITHKDGTREEHELANEEHGITSIGYSFWAKIGDKAHYFLVHPQNVLAIEMEEKEDNNG